MGCEAFRVERPAELVPAIEQALAAERPAVVEVLTSLRQTFQHVTSPLATQLRPARSGAR